MKETSNKDCVVKLQNVEISGEPGHSLSGWHLYPGTESPGESSEQISMLLEIRIFRLFS